MPIGGGGGFRVVQQIFLLDAIATVPTAAYSTRKLRAAYAGSAFSVRESGGGTEQDIGFTGGGLLDTTALLSFVGANNGFITKWYDQSGNARDLPQATAANQPQIIVSGTIQTLNGNPALKFIEANHTSLIGTFALSTIITSTAWSFAAISNTTTASQTGGNAEVTNCLFSDDGLDWYPHNVETNGGTPRFDTGVFDSGGNKFIRTGLTLGANLVAMAKQTGGNISQYQNGGTASTVAAGAIGDLTTVIKAGGNFTGNTFYYDGFCSEIIVSNGALSSADLNTLGNGAGIGAGGNMSTYGGVSWSSIP